MRSIPLREAKATFSAVVQAAEQGDTTTITKHGKPVAMVVPLPGARSAERPRNEGLIDLLLSFPRDLDLSREPWKPRDVDL